MKRSGWVVVVVLAALGGCTRGGEAPAPAPRGEHHDEGEHEALPRELELSPAVALDAGVETEPAVRAPLAATVGLPGEVAAEPDRTAQVSALTPGRLERVTFNEGTVVKQGEVLALLRVPDVGRLKGALQAATARARAARANAGRLGALKQSGLGAEQAVVDAEADARALEAEARALGDQLAAIGSGSDVAGGYLVPLRAPLSGVVVRRDAVVGQPVDVQHVLATVVDLSEVWFLGRVFEKDLGRLREGARAEVRLNAWPEERFAGTVDYVGQRTDSAARTLIARIRLKNPDGRLRLGLFGTARVEVKAPAPEPPRVLVPRSAVVDLGGRRVVFVREPDGHFVVHDVTLGEGALGKVQVLAGLDEGEAVAVKGVFTLKSLLLKSTLAEDDD